jgi:hypothetical protein
MSLFGRFTPQGRKRSWWCPQSPLWRVWAWFAAEILGVCDSANGSLIGSGLATCGDGPLSPRPRGTVMFIKAKWRHDGATA